MTPKKISTPAYWSYLPPIALFVLMLVFPAHGHTTTSPTASSQPAAPGAVAPAPAVTLPSPPRLSRDAGGVITITEQTPDTLILYTLDGSNPTAKSGAYLAPIDLSHGGIIKTSAFTLDRKKNSAVVTRGFRQLTGLAILPSTVVEVTQDRSWPDYDWAKRHASVCAAVIERKPELIFVGDSITHFWGGEPADLNPRGNKVWNEYYEKYRAVDAGFGWDRTENALWRVRRGEIDSEALKVVVLMIGTNNIDINKPDEIVQGVQAVCDAIHQRQPHAKILLLGIFQRGAKPDVARGKVDIVNKSLALFDGTDSITYLDIGKKFLNPDGTISPGIMSDGLHPTQKGYQIWADAMQPTLNRLIDAHDLQP